MALILPQNAAPPADPAVARLEAMLATLPDEWLLLRDRAIGGAGGPRAGFVLIHPEIGIALIDLAPARLSAAAEALEDVLAAEQFLGEDDTLPVVTVAVDPGDIPIVGEQLGDAFDAMPPCDMAERNWPRRIVDLLLHAEDAAMLPLPTAPAPARDELDAEREDVHGLAAPDEDERIPESAPRRNLVMAAVAAAAMLAICAGGAIAYLASAPAPETAPKVATAALNPSPPPSDKGTGSSMPAPPAPAPTQTATPIAPPAPLAASDQPVQPPPVADRPPPPPATPSPPPVAAAPEPPPSPPAQTEVAKSAPPPPVQASPPPDKVARTEPDRAEPAHKRAEPAAANKLVAQKPRAPAHKAATSPPKPAVSERKVATAEAPLHVRPAPPPDEDDGPPIDPADLPPLEGSDVPQGSSLGVASDAPFSGPPAIGKPMNLLPQVGPPVAMPSPPSFSPGAGTFVGPGTR